MQRRAPGISQLSTPRKEGDNFEILSGFFNGKTTGTPLCAVIYNQNTMSSDYEITKNLMRPGHADYTGYVRYNGHNDYRGGGHFSGRLTAPIVFAGAICKQILGNKNVFIGSHIKSIGMVKDDYFKQEDLKKEKLMKLSKNKFPVLNNKIGEEMINSILKAKEGGDSVGGIIETTMINLPPGIGNPFFNSVESTISQLLFSIPAVKGVEFGMGFDIASMKGSEANDEYFIDESNEIKAATNNNGGVLGGITNGMPLIFRVAIKPTPSISKNQNTVDMKKKENAILKIKGRHDPCIVPRAVPVVEAAAAIAIVDLMYSQ
jgi:chorismate synthase